MPRNRQLTEKKIQDAATRILQESGFEEWGINAIARKAGVDKVLIYRYFKSLDGLLETIIEATEFWPDPDSLSVLSPEAFIEETITFMQAEPEAWVLLAHPRLNARQSPLMQRFMARREQWLEGLLTHVSGPAIIDQMENLASIVHSLGSTGSDKVASQDLWHELFPRLTWRSQMSEVQDEELPVELL